MMKRIITLALLCAAFAGLRAQGTVGRVSLIPRLGVSLANMTNNTVEVFADYNSSKGSERFLKSAYKAGFTAGADVQYQLNEQHALSAGVFYTTRGYRYSNYEILEPEELHTGNSEVHTTIGYIDIPLMEHFYVVPGLALNLGVQPSFLVNGKIHSVTSVFTYDKEGKVVYKNDAQGNPMKDVETNHDIKSQLNKFYLSIPIGVSYEYMNVVLDARYCFGVSKVSGSKSFYANSRYQNFLFTVGYKFEL